MIDRDFASDEIIDISHLMVDPKNKNEFVIYGRTLKVLPEIHQAWKQFDWFAEHYNGRAVIRPVSRDFLQWEPAQFVMGPDLEDPVSTMIYSMNVFPYEGLYLGLVQRYISEPGIGAIDSVSIMEGAPSSIGRQRCRIVVHRPGA